MSEVTRRSLPIILIGGFNTPQIDAENISAHDGFNNSTLYRNKLGKSYVYEGMILNLIQCGYQDATSLIGYSSSVIIDESTVPKKLLYLEEMLQNDTFLPPYLQKYKDKNIIDILKRWRDLGYFSGDKVVIRLEVALDWMGRIDDISRTFWLFRYQDFSRTLRQFSSYGKALVRLIDMVRELTAYQEGFKPKVNIIAHSIGGLIVREAVQLTYPNIGLKADDYINKIVTLETPHQGVSSQMYKQWLVIELEENINHFSSEFQSDPHDPASYQHFNDFFPLERLLTVVGTEPRTYDSANTSLPYRLFQIPGAPRTFIHKSHRSFDSLVAARESWEVATRFLFGNMRMRLRMVRGKIIRTHNLFGNSEFFLGVCIKPRYFDFELFHQSVEAKNCYGPFSRADLSDAKEWVAFPWADNNRLIWEGYLDTTPILEDVSIHHKDLVMRLEFYVGERDLSGEGFSDSLIFHRQYYIRALLEIPVKLYLHTDGEFAQEGFEPTAEDEMRMTAEGWEFDVQDIGFEGTFCIEIDRVPQDGQPISLRS